MSSLGLEKYLSVDEKKKRRKKVKNGGGMKAKKFKGTGLRIVDEDGIGFNPLRGESSGEEETVEELPQIAAVVDERPREMQLMEEWKQGKWKTLETLNEEREKKGRRRRDSSSGSEDRDSSPPRRRRHDSDDGSLPRQRRRRQDLDGDESRPRKGHDSDESPPRSRKRHDSDDDLSPPRRDGKGSRKGDLSPPRRRNRRDSGDLSPPRPGRRKGSDDLSPPRQRKRHDSGDLSPPRSKRRGQGSDDLSPPRQRKQGGSSRDLSPPRNNSRQSRHPSSRTEQSNRREIAEPEIIEAPRGSVPGTTLEGKKAGLQRAADLRREMVDYRTRENELFQNLDDEVSGRNAVTKLRDRTTGKERDLAAESAKKEEEEKIAAERKQQYDKWGKGLRQVEARESRVNEALHEVSKPLARYADDRDLDAYLREQERDGDPMLKFLSSKKKSAAGGKEKPAYQGPQPLPNRFGIPPGYRWDGVDRANGYEKEWFSNINKRKAIQEEAYKWSVEDL